MSAQGCIELSTRDLYCIQTIYDQEDVFKLLVSCYVGLLLSHACVVLVLLLSNELNIWSHSAQFQNESVYEI